MAAREDWARITRRIQEAFSGLVDAVGSGRVARRELRLKPRQVRLVSWAGRADTDSWFRAQLEMSKNQALIYYAKNPVK